MIPLLGRAERAWKAAKLLADLGLPDEEVIGALTAALNRLDGPDQLWTARALARLGRLDLILDHADRLPQEAVVTAVAAPYTSFRDQGRTPLALNYRPLEDVLTSRPEYATALAEELKPGTPPCRINTDEVDEALRGLQSEHVLVRRHAVDVLGERQLGRAVGRRILPALSNAMVHDPDPTVRRLAVLSLRWWQRDAHPYVDVVRSVLDDTVGEVRAAAADWIRERDDLLETARDISR
ncbi:HEAT repeat domain-containing protein [Micromonospora sp. L32]|uniref:HEAT repeat domain-containing protein n=1 Tax=Micromonospora sp. L32 TaxID=3452214 RepID=UPI003F88DC17